MRVLIPSERKSDTATKYAVRALTEATRVEMRDKKAPVRVTAISPGLNPLFLNLDSYRYRKQWRIVTEFHENAVGNSSIYEKNPTLSTAVLLKITLDGGRYCCSRLICTRGSRTLLYKRYTPTSSRIIPFKPGKVGALMRPRDQYK